MVSKLSSVPAAGAAVTTEVLPAPIGAGFWVFAALLSASIEPVVAKLGYRDGLSPLQLLMWRNAFAALTILVAFRRVTWPGWVNLRLVVSVAVLLLLTNGLVLYALREVSVVAVVTAMTTTPAFVALVSRARGRVILGPRFWGGFAAAFTGVLLTVDVWSLRGAALPIAALLALALAVSSSTTYRTRLERVTRVIPPSTVSTWIFLVNAVLATSIVLPWLYLSGEAPMPARAVPIGLWTGVAAALANVAFLSAIRLVGATRMSIFDMLQRPLVIVIAALVLGEPFTWLQGVGVALVVGGVRIAKPKAVA